MLNIVFVHPVINENRKIHTDLRSGQSDAWGELHRAKHVVNELADVVADVVHGPSWPMKNGLSRDDDFANSHPLSLMSVP
jgi:hypothetical protein